MSTKAGFDAVHAFVVKGQTHYTREQVWKMACSLAERLPAQPYALNLFEDRLDFIVALMAVALKGGVTLLPPDTSTHTLNELAHGLNQPICVFGESPGLVMPALHWPQCPLDEASSSTLADNRFEALAQAQIWLYTSGTTGAPKKIVKTWHQMQIMAEKAIQRFAFSAQDTLVVTVPCQHMYGLETGVFWPLYSQARLVQSRPFYPADMEQVMAEYPQAVLVSTPFHLKTLLAFDGVRGSVKRIISATAPLPVAQAHALAQRFNTQVCEVLGSTETASFASRCFTTTDFEPWHLYVQNRLDFDGDQAALVVTDLNERYELSDALSAVDACRFELIGRRNDMIKIAGKRQSLARLNALLLHCVADGVMMLSPSGERLEAIVVAQASPQAIRQGLQHYMDPVFVPRQIYFVDQIPRTKIGKLRRADLDRLIEACRQKSESQCN